MTHDMIHDMTLDMTLDMTPLLLRRGEMMPVLDGGVEPSRRLLYQIRRRRPFVVRHRDALFPILNDGMSYQI